MIISYLAFIRIEYKNYSIIKVIIVMTVIALAQLNNELVAHQILLNFMPSQSGINDTNHQTTYTWNLFSYYFIYFMEFCLKWLKTFQNKNYVHELLITINNYYTEYCNKFQIVNFYPKTTNGAPVKVAFKPPLLRLVYTRLRFMPV